MQVVPEQEEEEAPRAKWQWHMINLIEDEMKVRPHKEPEVCDYKQTGTV